eukprot:CAMPEP_0194262432 /NCGR_PEP_ID=MMETSP0158-20130606/46541_1 /TAXON_ID=33649 /ORGANISM="Thalassionema nitzschioides, Strain L26-B" /LENGTH=357 /DNA_ID=CAMNT_0039002589 /DNA_START=88 /DNA_END=1161 /DNA_ORIENTATION=+
MTFDASGGSSFSFNFPFPSIDNGTTTTHDTTTTTRIIAGTAETAVPKEIKTFYFLSDTEKRLKAISSLDSTIVLKTTTHSNNNDNGDDDNHEYCLRRVCLSKKEESALLIQEDDLQQSDIIPGEYEGGLKVWECSLDLCRYLLKHLDTIMTATTQPIHYVAELGCGHGLPGCLVLQHALKNNNNKTKKTKVLFTDFNDFVLRDVTIPNIWLNTTSMHHFPVGDVAQSVVLGAGDWNQLSDAILRHQNDNNCAAKNSRFDMLLAAETTYTRETAQATAQLMARHLIPTNGVGLVATKRYYFGCGGGTEAFREAAASQENVIVDNNRSYKLDISLVEVYDNGAGNIRELLKVVLKEVVE